MSALIETLANVVKDDFRWTTMGEIADVIGGGTPRTSDPQNFEGGDIPWITPADLSGYAEKFIAGGNRHITRQGLASSSARMLPAGAVLFTSRAPIGYVAIAKNPIATNQGFKSFILKEGILPEYVYWWLKGSKQTAESYASGTTFLELSGANAKKLPIPMVSLARQREIVAEIEKQFSRLDEAVANLQRVKANLKRYKASVLKDAVEGRLVPLEAELARREGRSFETGEQLLQRILEARRKGWKGRGAFSESSGATVGTTDLPAGWVWTTLGQCFRVAVGATPSRKEPSYWGGYIPWVSSGEVQLGRIRHTDEHISEAGLANSSTQINPAGSVMIGMIGQGKTRGQAAILDIEAANNQNCAAIWVSRTAILTEYVFFWLMSRYTETRSEGSGNNQQALNKRLVEQIPLPLPPLAEQQRIVAEVDRRLSLVSNVEAEIHANLKRAQALRQATLQRAFSKKGQHD